MNESLSQQKPRIGRGQKCRTQEQADAADDSYLTQEQPEEHRLCFSHGEQSPNETK